MFFNSIKFGAIISAVMLLASSASAEEITVSQLNKNFMVKGAQVDTLTVKAGDSLKFQNEDSFFHNIFSLSDLKTFDLGSFPKGESKTVTFEKPGEADVECAIHPGMRLKVLVK